MGVFVVNVRPRVLCKHFTSEFCYNQYFIAITLLLVHSCSPKRIASYFCQDLFKGLVSSLSLRWWDLLSTIHMLISEGASSPRLFVHPPLTLIQGWLHVAVQSSLQCSTVAAWTLSGFEPRALCFHFALAICTDVAGSCLLSDLAV